MRPEPKVSNRMAIHGMPLNETIYKYKNRADFTGAVFLSTFKA
jgi:hypothetical protein